MVTKAPRRTGLHRRKANPNAGKSGVSGRYASKSTNLSPAVLRRAKAAKAARSRPIDISQTQRDFGAGVTRTASGKKLTGTVNLGGGRTAVYKAGKRVQASDAKKRAGGSSRNKSAGGGGAGTGGGGGGGGDSTRDKPKPIKVGTVRPGKGGRQDNRWNGKRWVPVPGSGKIKSYTPGGTAPTRAAGSVQNPRKATTGPVTAAMADRKAGESRARKSSQAAAVAGRPYGSRAIGKSALPPGSSKYATTTASHGHATKGEVATTLLAAGTLPLIGLAGGSALAGGAAARAAGGAAARAIGGTAGRQAVGGGTVKAIGGGASRAAAQAPKALTRGTPAQRAAATRTANQRALGNLKGGTKPAPKPTPNQAKLNDLTGGGKTANQAKLAGLKGGTKPAAKPAAKPATKPAATPRNTTPRPVTPTAAQRAAAAKAAKAAAARAAKAAKSKGL